MFIYSVNHSTRSFANVLALDSDCIVSILILALLFQLIHETYHSLRVAPDRLLGTCTPNDLMIVAHVDDCPG